MLLILGTAAHSATVIWPAVGFARTVDGDATYAIGSDASPSGGAAIGLEILDGPGNMSLLQAYSATAGIGHDWFAMQYGVAVDASAMADADYLANADTIDYGSIYMPLNQFFYIGFRLDGADYLPPDYNTPSYYIYGWAALHWDGTTLSLVDSAAETTGVGIYAGTYNPIPEPTTAGLALFGIAALLRRRRRIGGGT